MGLFVLKDSSSELLQHSFEDILNSINDKPKRILTSGQEVDEDGEEEESKEPQIIEKDNDGF